ncbi:MAG: RidA family protein [Caulobacterales bacterium]|nr:RidA family protein [Caulobacterales bacterium]
MTVKELERTRRVVSGAPWEGKVGYCRAVRVGPQIWVSGTAPVRADGSVYARGDAQRQAERCIELIKAALEDVGAQLSDVVRTRMFVTDISQWEAFGRAHAAAFGDHPPATSMVEVRSLIDPDMLIEIEAEAIVRG